MTRSDMSKQREAGSRVRLFENAMYTPNPNGHRPATRGPWSGTLELRIYAVYSGVLQVFGLHVCMCMVRVTAPCEEHAPQGHRPKQRPPSDSTWSNIFVTHTRLKSNPKYLKSKPYSPAPFTHQLADMRFDLHVYLIAKSYASIRYKINTHVTPVRVALPALLLTASPLLLGDLERREMPRLQHLTELSVVSTPRVC